MGIIRISRFTLTSDTPLTEKIDFNEFTKTNVENAFITGMKLNPTDGVGNNQGAEQDLGDQQALGTVEDIIKVSGFISKRNGDLNDGLNQFIALIDTWTSEPKINDDFELGRFGISDADDATTEVIPDNNPNTIALLWERIEWNIDFKGNRKLFDLFFRINRGDGT